MVPNSLAATLAEPAMVMAIATQETQKEPPQSVKMLYISTKNRVGRTIRAIYKEAFKRIGVNLTIKTCSAVVCRLKMRHGEADGELARSASYRLKMGNLVQVEEPAFFIHWSAFSKQKTLKLNSFDQLKQSKLRLVTLAGLVDIDDELTKIKASQVVKVSNWRQGLTRLKNDEADIFIGEKNTIVELLEASNNHDIVHSGILKTLSLHAFFAPRHRLLAPRLSAALKQMKVDGSMAKLNAMSAN